MSAPQNELNIKINCVEGGADADLYVRLVEEPGSMSQQLVDFVQVTQLLRDVLQSLEPALVSPLGEELLPLQLH